MPIYSIKLVFYFFNWGDMFYIYTKWVQNYSHNKPRQEGEMKQKGTKGLKMHIALLLLY